MKTLKTFLQDWVDHVAGRSQNSKATAVSFLQTICDATNAQAEAFIDALADYVGQLGLTNGNYAQLRDYVKDNPDAAKKLFDSIVPALRQVAAVQVIGKSIRVSEKARARAEINDDIDAVKIFRDAFTSANKTEQRAVKRALRAGLEALRAERAALNDEPHKPQSRATRAARRTL